MHVGIVGAGFAGLTTAKIMKQLGIDVTIFDRTPDVGGVWSAARRYPGLTTQNNRSTYGFSDYPMPDSYPEWPSGEQVQAYLQGYAETFGLVPDLRLSTEVVSATPETAGWRVTTRAAGRVGGVTAHQFDHLVIANGIFSDPYVPDFPGAVEFAAAGGRVWPVSKLADLDSARDQHVLVVGYGKSACDAAAAVTQVAATTQVIARELLWKVPKKIAGLNYKYLLLTRMGEALFRYLEPSRVERFLHGPGDPVRRGMLGMIQKIIVKQLRLRELDLVPSGSLERIARSTVSLATDGFYDHVADGSIRVRKNTTIRRLLATDGGPAAELDTGEIVRADLVLAGTGFRQDVPFLDRSVMERLTDERGNFELYRHLEPIEVPRLWFNGYNSSFFSPLSAEIGALWIVDRLLGRMALPAAEDRRREVARRLRWMEERTEGRHARGTNLIPFSIHNVDEMLSDLGIELSTTTRLRQWLLPLDPRAYRGVAAEVIQRHRGTPNALSEPERRAA